MEQTESEKALEIAQLLEDGKAQDVVVLDVSELNSWTDYFVIATVASSTLAQGLYRTVKDYVRTHDMAIHEAAHRHAPSPEWNLIDIGTVVVHLMSKDARDFYELEKLWHAGTKLR